MESSLLDKLPHRPPFRFLTAIESLVPGQAGTAVWRVTGEEPFFRGHFPRDPVVPGVLITEALAQLSGLVGLHDQGPRAGRLVQTELRFDASVIPPAEILLSSRKERSLGALVQFQVEALVAREIAARGMLVLAKVRSIEP